MFFCRSKRKERKNALNRHWRITTIDRMFSNYIYACDYQQRKRIKDEETILLENVCPAIINKRPLKLYTNLFQLEKLKYKSYYVRKNGLWNKLSKEQKSELIKKYIDSIEIEKIKDKTVIKKININKKEIEY